MNLAEEFTRLHEEWNRASVSEAPRARHAFAVFCHENAEAITSALTMWGKIHGKSAVDLLREETKNRSRAHFDVDRERIAFELWINSQSPITGEVPRGEHGYFATAVQSAWLGWCERAKGNY